MEYKKIEASSYNLHIIKTDKFKKTVVRINFKNKISRKDITYRKLINYILLESNSIYKTKRLLDIKTEELYNLYYSSTTQQSGNAIISSYTASFLSDKYQECLFNDSIEYISNILFKPFSKDNRFDTNVFNKAKEVLKEEIESFKENKPKYALHRCLKEMDQGVFSYLPVGYLEDLENVTESELYKYYLNMLKKDVIDIFVIGNVEFNNVIDIFNKYFNIKKIKKQKIKHYIKHTKIRNRYKKVIEETDANQSILLLGHKIDNLTNFERQYVLPIYCYILGGGPDSKLFKTVREKHSLCYSISASARVVSNALIVSAGINAKDERKAYRLTKKEILSMKNGEFTDNDIETAKTIYINAFREIVDNQYSIITNYVSYEYLNYDDIDQSINNIKKVNKKMVIKLSNKIHPDLMYLLKGEI